MPFANLPSSPGFQQPQAPDWTRFALQANENIQKGGEMRMQAGKDFAESIDKAASQISGIIEQSSPEAKMAKALKREALSAQYGLYQEYKKMDPATRANTFEFKNGMLQYKDKYKNLLQGVRLSNSVLQGQLLSKRLGAGNNPTLDYMRRQHAAGGYNNNLDNVSNPIATGDGSSNDNTAPDNLEEMMNVGGSDNENYGADVPDDQG